MKRFYSEVTVAEEGGAFRILLDGKPAKALALPTRALAEAIAEEWRGAGENIDFTQMPLTQLATGASSVDRARIAEQILVFGKSDHLCYRAEAPRELAARQAAAWDPLLAWAQQKYGARFAIARGVIFVEQPAEGLAALEKAVMGLSNFQLVAVHSAATICGSLVLALALGAGRLTAAQAFAAAHIDEAFQAEKWGEDAEAAARHKRLLRELTSAEQFLQYLRT